MSLLAQASAIAMFLCSACLSAAASSDNWTQLEEATVTLPTGCAGVVAGDGRRILTAAHCVPEGLAELDVTLHDGAQVPATLSEIDRERDIALFDLTEEAPVRPLLVHDQESHVGDSIFFTGREGGRSVRQRAEVERLGRCPSLPGVPRALFTSIRGEKGDSGSPLVDEELHVVGLVHGGAACSIATPTWEFAADINPPPGHENAAN